LGIFFDGWEDQKQTRNWEQDKNPEPMKLGELIDSAISGHKECDPEFCGSKYLCGDESCFCIRARFPSPSHYKAYLILREFGKELLFLKILASLSKETLGISSHRN
tara:strand:- start:365 stop:682 length:318 start_codon:yes stop_codon:yes gene_type:complete